MPNVQGFVYRDFIASLFGIAKIYKVQMLKIGISYNGKLCSTREIRLYSVMNRCVRYTVKGINKVAKEYI